MKLKDLQKRLADIKQKEVVAQTRETLLNEEKEKLLVSINELYDRIRPLKLMSEEELSPQNLTAVVEKIKAHMEADISESLIPPELI